MDFRDYYARLSAGAADFPGYDEFVASECVDPIAFLRGKEAGLDVRAFENLCHPKPVAAFFPKSPRCESWASQQAIRLAVAAGMTRDQLLVEEIAIPMFAIGPLVAVVHFDPARTSCPFIPSDLQVPLWIPDPASYRQCLAAFRDIVREFLDPSKPVTGTPFSPRPLAALSDSLKGASDGRIVQTLVRWAKESPFVARADQEPLESVLRISEKDAGWSKLSGDYASVLSCLVARRVSPIKGDMLKVFPDVAKRVGEAKLLGVVAYPYFETTSHVFVLVDREANYSVDDLLRQSLGSRTIVKVKATAESIQRILQGDRKVSSAQAAAFSNGSGHRHVAGHADHNAIALDPRVFEGKSWAETASGDSAAENILKRTLCDGSRNGASDVHIEVMGGELVIRHVVDGLGVVVYTGPAAHAAAIKNTLHTWCGVPTGRAQATDGRFACNFQGRPIDLRVAIDYALSASCGIDRPKAVLRLLDKTMGAKSLSDLGLSADEMQIIRTYTTLPHGMILVCGPTGSGKSTTLNAFVRELVRPEKMIYTAEDPVEYEIPGVMQRSVTSDPKKAEANKDLTTFPLALRGFLRMDPDILMVGEIRDPETALVSVEAAMTGHLLLSSLHTNDSIGAISRLERFGVERFNLAQALELVASQRLVRRVCSCHTLRRPSEDEKTFFLTNGVREELLKDAQLAEPCGCEECNHKGYRGRIAVLEFLRVTERVKNLIDQGASAGDLRKQADKDGYTPIALTGLHKVLQGITTLAEVKRVIRYTD